MIIQDFFNTPGEHKLLLQGNVGEIEASLVVPNEASLDIVALLGHPHSLQGGTMNNKVVTTLARAFKELGIASLRFNFRGVGQSAGEFAKGEGEALDLVRVSEWVKAQLPEASFVLAGFSFGSYVTFNAALEIAPKLLISIAPPVHHYDYNKHPIQCPWIVVMGDEDEVVPFDEVAGFFKQKPAVDFLTFEKTTHFFHGKLIELKARLLPAIKEHVPLV